MGFGCGDDGFVGRHVMNNVVFDIFQEGFGGMRRFGLIIYGLSQDDSDVSGC